MYKEKYLLDLYVEPGKTVIEEDASLPPDGYEVFVGRDGTLFGKYSCPRALSYLKRAVKDEILQKDGSYREVYIKDHPSFPIRGVIEGFYGERFSDKQRKDLIMFLKDIRMNLYIYAPKDDPYHREKWREPYPAAAMEKLIEFAGFCKENYVDFCFAISPGKDFDFLSREDFSVLLEKLKAFKAAGVERFAVLMDDIVPALTEKAASVFKDPAAAHAELLNYLSDNLNLDYPLMFCPTEYMQNFDTPYRKVLRERLTCDAEIFWTGYNTAAEAVTETDGETVRDAFGRDLLLWDNYPVNDFSPKRRVYLGAITGRGRYLYKTHRGYISNLSSLCESNKIPLYTMADYAWDSEGYRPEESLHRAVKKYFKGCFAAGMTFVKANESNVTAVKDHVKKLLKKNDFSGLDRYYGRLSEALNILEQKAPEAFTEELSDLFEFLSGECSVYYAMRGGADAATIEKLGFSLNECRYAPADLSLLGYINEKYDLKEPFIIDVRRTVYRRWN